MQARSGSLPLEQRLSGVVRADNQVSIRAQVEAQVTDVLVRSGDAVKKGQPLVRLEDDPLREQLRQAEANLRLAEASAQEAQARVEELQAQVSRSRRLAEEQLIATMELDTQEAQLSAAKAGAARARAAVDQARAAVEERRSALAKTTIRAPVSGRVGQLNVEIGMLVDPATELFTIGNLNDLIVEIPLTEEMLSFVKEGQPVRISSPAFDEEIKARLSRISPFLARGSFSTIAEIDVDNTGGRLKPGMFVNVDVLYGQTAEATLVPMSAFWEDPQTGREGIFVVEGTPAAERLSEQPHGVAFRPVEVIGAGRGMIGVKQIQPGQWVVTVGQHLLSRDQSAQARVRATTWESVLELQRLQRENLLERFLDKQQRYARERGAEPPSNEEFMNRGAAPPPGQSGAQQ